MRNERWEAGDVVRARGNKDDLPTFEMSGIPPHIFVASPNNKSFKKIPDTISVFHASFFAFASMTR